MCADSTLPAGRTLLCRNNQWAEHLIAITIDVDFTLSAHLVDTTIPGNLLGSAANAGNVPALSMVPLAEELRRSSIVVPRVCEAIHDIRARIALHLPSPRGAGGAGAASKRKLAADERSLAPAAKRPCHSAPSDATTTSTTSSSSSSSVVLHHSASSTATPPFSFVATRLAQVVDDRYARCHVPATTAPYDRAQPDHLSRSRSRSPRVMLCMLAFIKSLSRNNVEYRVLDSGSIEFDKNTLVFNGATRTWQLSFPAADELDCECRLGGYQLYDHKWHITYTNLGKDTYPNLMRQEVPCIHAVSELLRKWKLGTSKLTLTLPLANARLIADEPVEPYFGGRVKLERFRVPQLFFTFEPVCGVVALIR